MHRISEVEALIDIKKQVNEDLGRNDWLEISRRLQKTHGIYKSKEACRCLWKRIQQKGPETYQQYEEAIPQPPDPFELRTKLISDLQKEKTLEELIGRTKLPKNEVLGMIEQLRIDGYDIRRIQRQGTTLYYSSKTADTTYEQFEHYHDVDQTFKVGLVSDTHTSSKYWQRTYLHMAYDDFEKEGIHSVYHAGDISDGMYSNRAGNIYELYRFGYDEQLEEIIKEYPMRPGIVTNFITGNHDATHMMNGGANIGKGIEAARPDMVYLGHEYAKIWLTDKVDLDLIHPRDGTAYAYSYKTQKRIDAMSGGQKPKIMVTGHYHKNFFMQYRNIWTIGMPSFQAQSPFMRGMGLVSDVGYIILEIKVNKNGDLIEVTPRYKPFYVMKQEVYNR